MQQYQTEGINQAICKLHIAAGSEEVLASMKECSEGESEFQLLAAISEDDKQLCTKPLNAGVLLRDDGHQKCSNHHRYAQNRMSCPEFPMKIPENMVIGSFPLVVNANISKSSYSLGTYTNDEQVDIIEGEKPVGCRQNMKFNPPIAGLCLSEEEEEVHHRSINSSTNKVIHFFCSYIMITL